MERWMVGCSRPVGHDGYIWAEVEVDVGWERERERTPVLNSPYCLCGRKTTPKERMNKRTPDSELKSCISESRGGRRLGSHP